MKKLFIKALFLSLVSIFIAGCAAFSPDRSYIEEMERENEAFYNPGTDFPVVSGDSGEVGRSREEINKRTPASARAKKLKAESASIAEELRSKEENLEEEEQVVYGQHKKYLDTDSDKLYYLSLTPAERKTYINTRINDIKDEAEQKRNLVRRHSVHGSEIFLGMDKSDVVSLWGKPARIEIAGNPANQNERWSFVEDGSVKQVYFEEGKVHGWALDL